MRQALPIFLVLLCLPAYGADKKKDSLSDGELLSLAQKELESPSKKAPTAAGSGATISTKEVMPVEQRFLPQSEVEFSGQGYQPTGQGRISDTETYSLNEVRSVTMLGVGFRSWFNALSPSPASQVRWGLGAEAGIGRNTLNLHSSIGISYNDVRLTTVLPSVGLAAEWLLPRLQRVSLGIYSAYGHAFAVQSSATPTLNRTLQRNFLALEPSLRVFATDSFFLRMAYLYRKALGTTEDLGVQKNGVSLALGFGI